MIRRVGESDDQPKRRKPHGRNLPNAPRRLEAEDKQRQAWDLRVRGASFTQIAEQLGYLNEDGSPAHSAAISAVETWRRKVRQSAQGSVEAEIDRQSAALDELLLELWRGLAALGISDPRRLGFVDRVIRALDRQAKLLGLDAADQRDADRTAAMQLQAEVLFRVFDEALVGLGLAEEIRLAGRQQVARSLRLLEGGSEVPAIELGA